jgi:hypothetical protein
MKMLKKINFAILAVVLGLGLVFTQSAFKATAVTYHYKNLTETNITQANSWEVVDEETPVFSCDEGGDLPCVIEVDGSLQDFLTGKNAITIMASDESRETKSE